MKGLTMTMDEFDQLAFAYGGDLSDWPKDRRAVAAALLAQDADCRARIDQMAALDAALTVAAPVDAPVSKDLMARILADAATAASRQPQALPSLATKPLSPLRRVWEWLSVAGMPATACATSVVIGLWLGYAGPVDLASAATTIMNTDQAVEFAFLDETSATPFIDALSALEGVE